MFHIDNEFAYIITEPGTTDTDLSGWGDLAEEADNLAFIYNSSQAGERGARCGWGLAHLASHIGEWLAGGDEQTLLREIPLFEKVDINCNDFVFRGQLFSIKCC